MLISYCLQQLKCIVTAVAEHSTCSLTDTTCICLNKELNLAAAACIAKSCSVRDQLGMWSAACSELSSPVIVSYRLYDTSAFVPSQPLTKLCSHSEILKTHMRCRRRRPDGAGMDHRHRFRHTRLRSLLPQSGVPRVCGYTCNLGP